MHTYHILIVLMTRVRCGATGQKYLIQQMPIIQPVHKMDRDHVVAV